MDTKSVECFGTDPRAKGVRIELSPQASLVLPHEHFMYSEFNAGSEHDTLKLYFMNHEVLLTGYGLRRVEAAIHAKDLAWVAARQGRYRSQGTEKGFISNIAVRLVDEEEANATAPKLRG
jgi:hypothetical protein